MVAVWRGPIGRWDRRLFDEVARRHWPGADRVLPRLGRAADHGVLWGGIAAGALVFGTPRARRAVVRGAASLALASATINTVGKWSVRRPRPGFDGVPQARRPQRQPWTTSFPSGHSASAFAFATGVALESPALGAVLAPVAGSVAFSRVYTGVHYPADVAAGAALGLGAAWVVRRIAREADRARTAPGEAHPEFGAPALPEGRGLVLVLNTSGGSAGEVDLGVVRERLPEAEIVECEGEKLTEELAAAAERCAVLGVCGGDGTVNAAATAALAAGRPLAVFPGGTLNHFAADLGLTGIEDTCAAVARGEAVRVAAGRFRPGPSGAEQGWFLNTFSIGVYPELLGHRLRWAPRIGGGPAAVLAAAKVLRKERPLRLTIAGRERSVWMLFAGNGTYHGSGPTPRRRLSLREEGMDLRLVHGGARPGSRLLAAALAGPLTRSPAHLATRLASLRVSGIPAGTPLAFDGEYAMAPEELTLSTVPRALTVYRPYRKD
ncbi:bifunctional phosphatase PAP2/diacylglycerol kinase family protein [Streptomyces sp. BI20]|uniref:bifunctional phosphatase PAP2/diacylglycerol kinase family protein n=1 Tax=Streptomyces sp. BI20 TaxID=3403460 RepID=UPI003C768C29